MTKVKLNKTASIDLPKLITSRMLIQANSGGGKSWLIRRILEQSHGKVQQIVIDPEGEFGTLREKFDYVLAGKGGDVPANPRTAALLARRLLETKASAIIDLYELPPQERKRFVRLFMDAMVNAPKELYHEVLIVLDEAHIFVPEKEQSEASSAVIDLCTRGRKRGFCAVLATQRISKLAKDAAAECNNKLIGRTSLDIDIKRAGEELGFTSKEQLRDLRKLKPGEFFAFGPALSDDVEQITIGEVSTSHPKIGSRTLSHVPPASASVKKMLAQFKDLPAEAEEEARTVADLKAQITSLKRHKCPTVSQDPEAVEKAVAKAVAARDAEWRPQIEGANREIRRLGGIITKAGQILGAEQTTAVIEGPSDMKPFVITEKNVDKVVKTLKKQIGDIPPTPPLIVDMGEGTELTGAEQKILEAVRFFESIGVPTPEKAAVAAVAGFRPTSGHFKNSCGGLRSKGLVEYPGGNIALTDAGRSQATEFDHISSNEDLHRRIMEKLDGAQKRILQPLLEVYPSAMTNENLAMDAGFQATSGHFKNTKGSLRTYGLIEYPESGMARARSILFPFG